jgi:hypothetical protein
MLAWFFLLTNWKMTCIWFILEQLWESFLATTIPAHLVPFSKGQTGSLSPLGVLFKKNCAISRQTFYINFSASRCGQSHDLFHKKQWSIQPLIWPQLIFLKLHPFFMIRRFFCRTLYSVSLLRLLVNLQTSTFRFLFQGLVFMAPSSDGEEAVGLAMLINCSRHSPGKCDERTWENPFISCCG